MADPIFRKKSLERVQSPESLNDYMQVTNPSVWVLLIGIIVLLAGACVWGFFGEIENTADAVCVVKDGQFCCYSDEFELGALPEHCTVRINGETAVLMQDPLDIAAPYLDTLGGRLSYCGWGACFAADGRYDAELVLEPIRPISFIFN